MIPVILNSPSDQEVVVTIASGLGDRLDVKNLTVTFPPGETGPLVRILPAALRWWDLPCHAADGWGARLLTSVMRMQAIAVEAPDNGKPLPDVSGTLTFTSSSVSGIYDGLVQTVDVNVLEDRPVGIRVRGKALFPFQRPSSRMSFSWAKLLCREITALRSGNGCAGDTIVRGSAGQQQQCR